MIEIRILIAQTDLSLVNVLTQMTATDPLDIESVMCLRLGEELDDIIEQAAFAYPGLRVAHREVNPPSKSDISGK